MFVLFDGTGEHSYIAQSGLTGGKLPNHRTLYQAESNSYRLADGGDQVELRLRAPEVDGVQVTKVYRFRRGSYLIDVGSRSRPKRGRDTSVRVFPAGGGKPRGHSAMFPTFTGVFCLVFFFFFFFYWVYPDKSNSEDTFEEIEKGKSAYPKPQRRWIAITRLISS